MQEGWRNIKSFKSWLQTLKTTMTYVSMPDYIKTGLGFVITVVTLGTIPAGNYFNNPLKASGKLYVPPALTINGSVYCTCVSHDFHRRE
jgi:hypothetical protein